MLEVRVLRRIQISKIDATFAVCERVVGHDENMLHLYHKLRHDSLQRFRYLRFYLQAKEDPHGANVEIFVANLPANKRQREYENALLRLLGAGGMLARIRRAHPTQNGRSRRSGPSTTSTARSCSPSRRPRTRRPPS